PRLPAGHPLHRRCHRLPERRPGEDSHLGRPLLPGLADALPARAGALRAPLLEGAAAAAPHDPLRGAPARRRLSPYQPWARRTLTTVFAMIDMSSQGDQLRI